MISEANARPPLNPTNSLAISVTIVNHGVCDLLRDCLQSLVKHPYTMGSMEVVVLDNASDDRSLEMLRDEFPDVLVMAENVRRGFGANQNRAIARSSGELVFLLNPDAVVGLGTLDALAEAVQIERKVVAAGCPTMNSDGTARQRFPIRFPTPLNIYLKAVGVQRFRRNHQLDGDSLGEYWLSGGAMIIDRESFLSVGGFDEEFFMYSEDVDLCRRLRVTGASFAWVPNVSVTHPLPSDSAETSEPRQREMVRSELSYMTKHFGGVGQIVFRLGAILDCTIRVLALTLPGISRTVDVHGRHPRDIRALRLARLSALLSPSAADGGLRELAYLRNSQPPPSDVDER